MDMSGRLGPVLAEFVERWQDSLNLPGVALAVTDRKRTVHVGAHGVADVASGRPLTPGHLLEIGSISKSFTAFAIVQAAESGLVSLDDPVAGMLPWLRGGAAWQTVTVRHLLTHTAGLIQGTEAAADAAPEAWSLRGSGDGGPPGRRFHYSNAGYKVAGLILEALLGEPAPEVIRRRLLAPIGMTGSDAAITNATRLRLATGHEAFFGDRPLPPGGRLAAATWLETATADGNVASTAADMARYVRLLLNRGRLPDGSRVVSRDGFAAMIESVVDTGEDPGHPGGYGLGLGVYHDAGSTVIGHAGGMVGYAAHILADLTAGVGVAVLANGPGGCRALAWHALRVARACQAGEDPPPGPGDIDPFLVPDAPAWAGAYRGDGLSCTLAARDGRVTLDGDGGPVPLARVAGGLLAPRAPYDLFPLRPIRDGQRVIGLAHGARRMAAAGCALPSARPHPRRWQAFTGHYRSHNPWFTNFRVVLRAGELFLIAPGGSEAPDAEERLVPLPGGSFRIGEDPGSPERARFGAMNGGAALRCVVSGAEFWRTFTP